MRFTIMATLFLSFTTIATTINDKPSLGLSYSYLWDYRHTYKYFDTHILSIYGGLPLIKERANIGFEAGIEIPFTNKYNYNRSHADLYIGSDTNIYMAKYIEHSFEKSTNISISIPVRLYVNSFFLETAIGANFSIGKQTINDTTTYYSRHLEGFVPFDTNTCHLEGNVFSFTNIIIYSLGYQLNHFQFMITGRGLFSVGFEIRYLYWKK